MKLLREPSIVMTYHSIWKSTKTHSYSNVERINLPNNKKNKIPSAFILNTIELNLDGKHVLRMCADIQIKKW